MSPVAVAVMGYSMGYALTVHYNYDSVVNTMSQVLNIICLSLIIITVQQPGPWPNGDSDGPSGGFSKQFPCLAAAKRELSRASRLCAWVLSIVGLFLTVMGLAIHLVLTYFGATKLAILGGVCQSITLPVTPNLLAT
jgi:hypothetical protein